MAVARPGRRDFQLRVNGVLGGIDADRPDVRSRKFSALARPPRPDQARAVHALDRVDVPAEERLRIGGLGLLPPGLGQRRVDEGAERLVVAAVNWRRADPTRTTTKDLRDHPPTPPTRVPLTTPRFRHAADRVTESGRKHRWKANTPKGYSEFQANSAAKLCADRI